MEENLAVEGKERRKASRSLYDFWKKIKRDKFLLLIFAPGLLYFIIFKYIPMIGILISFQNYNLFLGFLKSQWVGLTNFQVLFTSSNFGTIIGNTLFLNVYSLIFGFPLPIIFALALNESRSARFKKLTQTVSYLPHFISVVIIAGMVTEFLSPSTGFIAKGIGALLHTDAPYLLANPRYFRAIYVLTGMWEGFGWGAIIYIAALSGVDVQLYEAAEIDGATRFQRIVHITFPALVPTVVIMLIINIGSLMSSSFDLIYLLQNDLNLSTSEVISTFVYKRGILGMGANVLPNYGLSTAANLFQSMINLVLVTSANVISRKVSEVSLW